MVQPPRNPSIEDWMLTITRVLELRVEALERRLKVVETHALRWITRAVSAESQTPTSVEIRIKSIPPGADIKLDGFFIGVSPCAAKAPPGKHQIRATKDGFKSWERILTVSDRETAFTAALQAEDPLAR